MAQRAFWKGYLKLSLVTCPVALTPATTEMEKVRFHTLNRKTGNRVVSRYVDAVSGKPVKEGDEVKGYPRGESDYVVLEDEEIDSVALESTHTIDITSFVPTDSIDTIWFDTPHFLTPNDEVAEEAFSVIREAMASSGMAGLSRIVMYRRERAVALTPRDKGIILWTLRFADEVRSTDDCFSAIKDEVIDPKLMKLVTSLIDERTESWSPDFVKDPVQDHLREIIASKKKGSKASKKPPRRQQAEPDNVINIMDALRKSLSSGVRGRRS